MADQLVLFPFAAERAGPAPDPLARACAAIEAFEARPSVPGAPSGSRRDGATFEALVGRWLEAIADVAERAGAERVELAAGGVRIVRLVAGDRSLVVGLPGRPRARIPAQPDEAAAVARGLSCDQLFAAASPGRLALAAGSRVVFDGAFARFAGGALVERTVIEAKSAKGRDGHLEGNAHERLAFGLFAIAEAHRAAPALGCLVVLNGAFGRYRSRYPTAFEVLAARLREANPSLRLRFVDDARSARTVADELLGWLRDTPALAAA